MTHDGAVRWYLVFSRQGDTEPRGLARQLLDADGAVVGEESFGRSGSWQPTELFRHQWLGRNDDHLVEVPQEEVERWVAVYEERVRPQD